LKTVFGRIGSFGGTQDDNSRAVGTCHVISDVCYNLLDVLCIAWVLVAGILITVDVGIPISEAFCTNIRTIIHSFCLVIFNVSHQGK
jgi:hypothetical protein